METKRQIFVFGSNRQGRHGKGSALEAVRRHGAVYGQPDGLQGNSYGIVTKELRRDRAPVTLDEIRIGVNSLSPNSSTLRSMSSVGVIIRGRSVIRSNPRWSVPAIDENTEPGSLSRAGESQRAIDRIVIGERERRHADLGGAAD